MTETESPEAVHAILEALEDSRYEWRTVDGLSKSTGLSHEAIENVLYGGALDDLVVQSASLDRRGRALYTTRKRYNARSTVWSRMRDALTGRIAS